MNIAKNHYDDCPYHCNDKGMLLDTVSGKLIPCPHCYKKKSELVAKGYAEELESSSSVPLNVIFGINSPYLTSKFVYESVIPDSEVVFIEKESMIRQKEESERLYQDLSIGSLPNSSLCFGISIKGKVDMFSYPIMAKAYLANFSIPAMVSCSQFARMCMRDVDDVDKYYEDDLVLMLINDGCNLADLASAKGLMQTRGLKGKPTVFVTTWTIEACSSLLSGYSEESLLLAKPIFVEYKKHKGKHSSYINNLIGVPNKRASSDADYGTTLDNL